MIRTPIAALALAAVVLIAQSAAQPAASFSGVWVVDVEARAAGDVYGEARIVRQGGDAVPLLSVSFRARDRGRSSARAFGCDELAGTAARSPAVEADRPRHDAHDVGIGVIGG